MSLHDGLIMILIERNSPRGDLARRSRQKMMATWGSESFSKVFHGDVRSSRS